MEMDTKNQIMDKIKNALEMKKPSKKKKKILSYLYTLSTNDSLSNLEFFDIIGKTFNLIPKFFMLSIYPKIRRKFSKIYGDEGIRVMDKHILKKYYLNEGELIIYELNGTIRQQVPKKYKIQVLRGTIYVTNDRIIAQGKFILIPHESFKQFLIRDIRYPFRTEYGHQMNVTDKYLSDVASCYGYMFPTQNLYGLKKYHGRLSYSVKHGIRLIKDDCRITIIPSRKEDHEDKLYTILDKFQIPK